MRQKQAAAKLRQLSQHTSVSRHSLVEYPSTLSVFHATSDGEVKEKGEWGP